jgi:hypothetical protein
MNPAREVKTERFSRTEGKTPAFVEGEVQQLTNITKRRLNNFFIEKDLLSPGRIIFYSQLSSRLVYFRIEPVFFLGRRSARLSRRPKQQLPSTAEI